MKQKLRVITVLASLFVSPAWASSSIEKTLDATSGERLEIDLGHGGDVYISGWDRPEVQVLVSPGGLDQDNVRVEIETVRTGVRVQSRMIQKRRRHRTSFKYEFKVPMRYDLKIDSMGGDIRISGVEGEIVGGTMGGELDLRDLRGHLDLSTMGGEIVMENSNVDGKVSTMDGDVDLRDVVGNVDAETMGGDVRYHNVQRRQGNDARVVKISTMGGRIDVPEAPGGAKLESMGGEITVGRAKVFVKAETMGGEILIREIDGWVDAETMGGDVEVTMVGDPTQGRRDVSIESMGGKILLTVPDGLSMRFEIRIDITQQAKRDYTIHSDFPVKIEKRKRSRDRLVIIGSGDVGTAEHRIRIRTFNGDVEIRRGQ